jgi:hypothetical protein
MLEEFEEAREQCAPRMAFDAETVAAAVDERHVAGLAFAPRGPAFRPARPSRSAPARRRRRFAS